MADNTMVVSTGRQDDLYLPPGLPHTTNGAVMTASAPLVPGGATFGSLLIGEQRLLLQGLAKLLHDQLGTACQILDRRTEIAQIEHRPDFGIVLAETSDATLAGGWLSNLHRSLGLPLVVLAPGALDQFFAAIRAGARGFISREVDADQVVSCIQAVLRGEWGIPRSYVGALAEAYLKLQNGAEPQPAVALTDRERKVLRLAADGQAAVRIGQALFVSESTVRADIRAVMHKLGAQNTTQAVREAIQRGLIDLDSPEGASV
jgi:DNA-binding NarL/FixJ family response regulator